MRVVPVLFFVGTCLVFAGCAVSHQHPVSIPPLTIRGNAAPILNRVPVIHVVVALCDNKYQGIIPVPARIGNGDDLVDNLYWGADYGVKSYFRHRSDWKLVQSIKNPSPVILERIVFTNGKSHAVLVADAYRGREIKRATEDFLSFAGGNQPSALKVDKYNLTVGGGADYLIYVGHDGLMNFAVAPPRPSIQNQPKKIAVLCCKSQQFFAPAIKSVNAVPVLWTKSLMAPEAYVVEAATQSFLKKERGTKATERASAAYAKYQHISVKAARTVFASGF